MYAGSDIESLMPYNVTDPEKYIFFLFQMNTKSNRSSIKSQSLIALFISAPYSNSVAICHEEMQFACFPGLLHTHHSHSICQRELNEWVKMPLSISLTQLSPRPNLMLIFVTLRVVETG